MMSFLTFLPVMRETRLPSLPCASEPLRLPNSVSILSRSLSNPSPVGPPIPSAIPNASAGIFSGLVA